MASTKFNSVEGFSVGTYPTVEVIDRNGNIITNSLRVTGLANFGNVSNILISGGTSGQVLSTDGNGNINFSTVTDRPANGPELSLQYNNGNYFAGDANLTYQPSTGELTATKFVGDGSKLSNISGPNVVGIVPVANYALYANVTLNSLASETTQFVVGNNQPNINNLGNLDQLNVTGSLLADALIANSSLLVQGDATIKGNLIVQGKAIYSNVETINVKDPMIELGGDPFGGQLTGNDEINRGLLIHYFDSIPLTAFMGWDSNSKQFSFASNVSVVNNEVIVHSLGNLQAQNFIGNGVGITEIQGANVTGTVANANFSLSANYANYAGYIVRSNQPNITTLGTLTTLDVNGNSNLGTRAQATYFVGDGANLSNITGANVLGTVANSNHSTYATYANTAETVIVSEQPNITSVGTLLNLDVTGLIKSGTGANLGDYVIANRFVGDGGNLSNITGANVTGTVANAVRANYANFAGQVVNSTQPNITSVGTLVSLNVTGDVTGNLVTANIFSGNGTYLSNVPGANITGTVANANFSAYSEQANSANYAITVTGDYQPNITSIGDLIRLTVLGNITSGNADLGNTAIANFFIGDGQYLANITGANVLGVVANSNYSAFSNRATLADTALLAGSVTTSEQPNITSVGILTSLTVSDLGTGNIIADNANLGNLVEANFFSGDGQYLVNLSGDNVTGIVANANYAAYAGLATTAVSATTAGSVTTSTQPNITSVGTLTSLVVNGNITSGNANLGNAVIANFFIGNGHYLSSLNGANISEVPNANFATYSSEATHAIHADTADTATTITASAQPNITSVGILNSLAVAANVIAENFNAITSVTARYFVGDGANLSGINGANVSEVPNANFATYSGHAVNSDVAITVTASEQPNIHSVGTLLDLDVNGNVTISNNLTVGNTVFSNYFTGNGHYLYNINGANVSQVANANYARYTGLADLSNVAITVSSSSQPNITNVGTLTSLQVAGNILTGNANLGNIAKANYFIGDGSLLSNIVVPVSNIIANGNSNVTVFETSIGLSANGISNVVSIEYNQVNVAGNINVTDNISAISVNATTLTGSLTTGAQPNITSVGTLTSLVVSGDINAANVYANVSGGNISGNIQAPGSTTQVVFNKNGITGASANFTFDDSSSNLSVDGNVKISGNFYRDDKAVPVFSTSAGAPSTPVPGDQWYDTDTDIIYQYIYNGTAHAWVDISAGFINSNVDVYANTLALRDDSGNLRANNFTGNSIVVTDATISGNLAVGGTFTYVNSSTVDIKDPIIELGADANGATLTVDDNLDRGTLLHYYVNDGIINAPVDAFMGWDNSNSEFSFGSNVTLNAGVVTFNELASLRAGYFIGDGSNLFNIPASAIQPPNANVVPLGMSTDGDLQNPGIITSWETTTTVTDAIDDLNEAMENIRNNTYIKSVNFTASPTAGGAGTTVTLTITSVGNPNRYDITWGDGTQTLATSSTTPTHVYSTNTNSPFTVTVRAYNNGGTGKGSEASSTRADYIIIYTADPVMGFGIYRASTGGAALTGSSLYASEGDTVYLENTTTSTSGATVTYTINWGDGNTDTITSDSAAGGVGGGRKSHTYASGSNSGTSTKTITLTLTSHTTANPASIPRNTTAAIKIYNPSIAAPNGLSSKTIAFQTSVGTNPLLAANFANNTGGVTSIAAGSSISRVTTATPVETIVMSTYAYNADSGYLRAFINGSEDGNITLASGSQVGTNLSLALSAESDYNLLDATGTATTFGLSIYSPSLYKGFTAKVSKTNSALTVGVNDFKLSHSITGNTNIVEFVKDDVTSVPTVDVSTATLSNATNGTYRYISGIPYYNTGSPTITLTGAKVYNWIGQTYQNTTIPFQIEPGTNDESTTGNIVSSQTKTYSQLDGASTFLSGGIPKANTGNTSSNQYTIGSQTINITALAVASVQTVKFLVTNVNGSSAYAAHSKKVQVFTATPSGFVEDNISVTSTSSLWSDAGKRIVISGASGATPAYNSSTNYYTSAAWSGAQTIAGTDEAVVRWNQLKQFSTDLTGYLPAGPNLATGRSGTQYFRGAFRRNAKSSITVTITGKISGLYIAAPGTAIDSASTINGWLDASLAYNGSGVPGTNSMAGGTNGCAVGTLVPYGSVITNQTYTLTLGTVSTSNSTGNQILFSIALAPGDYVTSWSFG
jgi:hypothetical protein